LRRRLWPTTPATASRPSIPGDRAAHRSLPFGTKLRVRRVDNGKHLIVRINDRGPFINGRIVDLSVHAARELGMIGRGLAFVKVEVIAD
jgi:rare lipoprotein A